MPTYYEVLGCDKNASYEEIKRCYHELVKKCHPDKLKEESELKFDILDKAWKTLRNAESRREYDLKIAKNDLDELPLYCEVGLSDMSYETETDTYNYNCRCGGVYTLNKSDVKGFERFQIPCDECTFHIVVLANE